MGMALDEPKVDDQKLDVAGIVFLVGPQEQPLVQEGQGLRVDFASSLFGERFFVEPLSPCGSGSCC